MKLGIGLPTYHGNLVRASDMLDRASLGEDARTAGVRDGRAVRAARR